MAVGCVLHVHRHCASNSVPFCAPFLVPCKQCHGMQEASCNEHQGGRCAASEHLQAQRLHAAAQGCWLGRRLACHTAAAQVQALQAPQGAPLPWQAAQPIDRPLDLYINSSMTQQTCGMAGMQHTEAEADTLLCSSMTSGYWAQSTPHGTKTHIQAQCCGCCGATHGQVKQRGTHRAQEGQVHVLQALQVGPGRRQGAVQGRVVAEVDERQGGQA